MHYLVFSLELSRKKDKEVYVVRPVDADVPIFVVPDSSVLIRREAALQTALNELHKMELVVVSVTPTTGERFLIVAKRK